MSSPTAEDAPTDLPRDVGQPRDDDPPPAGDSPSGAAPRTAAEEPAPAGPRPKLSGIAVAAVVTGVLPLVPAGIGLGIAGLVATRRGRRRGRGLALGGLLAATGWLAVGAALGTVAALTHGFHKPVKVEYSYGQSAALFGLRAGECITMSPNGTSLTPVLCTTPHDAEVFATFGLRGSAWPGTAAVAQEADTGCSSRLAGYLNPQLAIGLSQDDVYPGQVAWQTGTRTVICVVRATTGQLDQSVRGAS
jgi:hypothetical protein